MHNYVVFLQFHHLVFLMFSLKSSMLDIVQWTTLTYLHCNLTRSLFLGIPHLIVTYKYFAFALLM